MNRKVNHDGFLLEECEVEQRRDKDKSSEDINDFEPVCESIDTESDSSTSTDEYEVGSFVVDDDITDSDEGLNKQFSSESNEKGQDIPNERCERCCISNMQMGAN